MTQGTPPSYSFTPDATLEALLHDLYRRFPPLGRGDPAAFASLCAALGNPQDSLPPVFHVAGTNGKGSTLAFLHALCAGAGLRVHAYTSPHLVRFEERVVVAGRMAGSAALTDALRAAARHAPAEMNFFSVLTAAAFLLFAQSQADVVLLETGVGGALDPTNIVTPDVSIITRISFDHMQLLGPTLADIAASKAGIIKPLRPVVLAPQHDSVVEDVIVRAARAQGAPLYPAGRVALHDDGFSYDDGRRVMTLPAPALAGAHQMINAATALTALGRSRFCAVLDDAARVAQAMRAVRWPGRLQRLTQGPLCTLLGPQDELWVDGAHNDSGAEVLAAQCAAWRAVDGKALHLLVAFKGRKDWEAFVAPLLEKVDSLSCVQPDVDPLTARVLAPAGALWAEIASAFPAARHGAIAAGSGGLSPQAAIQRLSPPFEDGAKPSIVGRRVVIAGSLYLAGHILRTHS